MIDINKIERVFVATCKVDFRKSFDGLLAESYRLGLDPIKGDLVLFLSHSGHNIKLLFCDASGIWVINKRFYERKIQRQMFKQTLEYHEIDAILLNKLLEGERWNQIVTR